MNKPKQVCSCGCTEPHVIMQRTTFDGYTAYLWSDGALVDRMGNGRRPSYKSLPARVRRMGNASILTWAELIA